MSSCAIFGHRNFSYNRYRAMIEEELSCLIFEKKITEFYVGARGDFDLLCIEILRKLQKENKGIKIIRVWSYMPQGEKKREEELFDGSVYFLDKCVPPLYAILETNKCMVKKADCIFSGVVHDWGGAWTAVEYARKQGKNIIKAVSDSL